MNATIKKPKKKIRPIRVVFILTFITVPTIHFLLSYVYVNANSLIMAFYWTVGGKRVWGFDNFTRFFSEFSANRSELVVSFKNTLYTFLIQTALFPIGIAVSYFLYKKVFLHRVYRTLFFMPMIISSVVTVAVFKGFVSPEGGLARMLQRLWKSDHVPDIFGDFRFANLGIWAYMIWLNLPGNLILWGGNFARIPTSIIEAGQIDGIGWFRELRSVILPLVWNTFVLLLMLHCVGIFGASGQVFLFTAGRWDTQTFSNWMYMQVYGANDPNSNAFNYMSAVGMIITALSSVIAIAVNRLNKKFREVEY